MVLENLDDRAQQELKVQLAHLGLLESLVDQEVPVLLDQRDQWVYLDQL